MGKLRQTALIMGEGPTEFFYFKSLCDVFKRLTIKPDYPKHTNIKELDAKIAEGVAMGYNHIFCIIDMGLGSEIFSVKVSHESGGASNDKIYVKKSDYDECIYLVKHTDETAQAFITVMQGVNKQINDQTMNDVTQSLNAKIKSGELSMNPETLKVLARTLFEEKNGAAMMRVLEKEKYSIHKALESLRFEAVLNHQQF